jgi:translation initiation factor 5A
MVLKVIEATQARPGTMILIDGEPCTVKSMDTSKTGKHGAAKCRIEATEVFTGKKKIIAVPGHERFEVPLLEKHKAQVLSVSDNTASVMDLDSFETLELAFSPDLEGVEADKHVEYWDIEGKKAIIRVL